jgi:hypothetical protein
MDVINVRIYSETLEGEKNHFAGFNRRGLWEAMLL